MKRLRTLAMDFRTVLNATRGQGRIEYALMADFVGLTTTGDAAGHYQQHQCRVQQDHGSC